MNPQIAEIDDWIENIFDNLQETLQSGEDLPDSLYDLIADEVEKAYQEIQKLEQQSGKFTISGAKGPGASGPQLMWILAGGNPEAFVNYLTTYPDPELRQLARNSYELNRTIQDLQEKFPKPEVLGQQDGIPHADLNSSNIYGFRYDPKTQKLLVRFQGGSIYGYDNVPTAIFNIFQHGAIPAKTSGRNQYGKWWTGKIPSLGAAFYQLVRQGGYPYQKLH